MGLLFLSWSVGKNAPVNEIKTALWLHVVWCDLRLLTIFSRRRKEST